MILGLDVPVKLDNGRMVPAVNLDNAATTPAFKQVAEEVHEKLKYYGPIGRSVGQKSAYSSEIYTNGRETVKAFVGADDSYTTIYTHHTTDGMNKLASALIDSRDDIILSTRMEHHANDLPWRERAKTLYAEVDEQGRLNLDDMRRILSQHRGKIKYVTVTAASNVTGYVNDVHKIAALAHEFGAGIIVDGAQIVSHRKFNMLGNTPGENIDFFVFSAHKMYSPFGGGAIVGLTKRLEGRIPHFYGGGMVDAVYDNRVFYTEAPDLFEAGSPNYPGVVGMLKSMKILEKIGFDYIAEHEQRLLKYTIDRLKRIPEVILYGDNEKYDDRVGIVVFNIDGIDNQIVAEKLAGLSAIAVRHAAFCAHPYVRRLTGELPYKYKEGEEPTHPVGMVRVSFGIYNTEEDVDVLVKTIRAIINGKDNLSRAFKANCARCPNDRA
jgi:selenocysteine lyase/cysteine desulfurase